MKKVNKLRRGSRPGQAPAKAYADAGGPHDRAKIARLGRIYSQDEGSLFLDCLLVANYCPNVAPNLAEITDPKLRDVLAFGWRITLALKRFQAEDRKFIERLIRVRDSSNFRNIRMRRAVEPIDPLRVALCTLAQEQEDMALKMMSAVKKHQKTKPPMPKTITQVRNYLAKRFIDDDFTDKALRYACKDAGVVMAKPGAPKKSRS